MLKEEDSLRNFIDRYDFLLMNSKGGRKKCRKRKAKETFNVSIEH